MGKHDQHEVTAKAALYSSDGLGVLIMKYFEDGKEWGYGLPGGHLDRDESLPKKVEEPIDALKRELSEEIGITIDNLTLRDCFIHYSGKVVLGYVGIIPIKSEIINLNPDKEVGLMMTREELDVLKFDEGYFRLVTANWPN
jgi:8-oxo-dGTP pyrophosphatase MutT (NUDIX family)